MTRLEQLRHTLGWHPATGTIDIDRIEAALGLALPDDYRDFLESTDGFEGIIDQVYLVLLGPSQLVEANRQASIAKLHPDHVMIGGNAAGEWFLLHTSASQYLMIPGIGSASGAIAQGTTLESFLDRTFRDQWFDRVSPDKRRENR